MMTRTALSARRLLRSLSVGAVRLVGRHVVWRRAEDEYAIWRERNVYSDARPGRPCSLSRTIDLLTLPEVPS